MRVCTVLSSYCWRSFNFSALEEGPLLDHKHIQELGSAKSALHTFKFRNETPIATSSNCFVLSHKQSKPQRYSIYHHFQQILTYFMKNWTQRMFSWNENTSVMKPNPTQTCFLRTLQNPRCIFSQDSHKKKNASLYCRKSTLCLIPACTTSFWN